MTGASGRDIIDPDLPIIDAHHHLYDRPQIRYLLDEYLADANAGHRIIGSVYVETLAMARADGPEHLRPIGEVEFANGVGAMSASGRYGPSRVSAGIVGYADLRAGDRVGDLLDQYMAIAPDRFRGIRQLTMEHPDEATWRYVANPPPAGILTAPGFRPAFAHLAPRQLSFDAAVFHHQLGDLVDLADAFPGTSIVLNHMGQAMALDMGEDVRRSVFQEWRTALRDLAQRPNVTCKVGGLGLPFWGFGFESRAENVGYLELADAWRPYVETAVELFGPHRCMMESNFPVDGRASSFAEVLNALKHIVQGASNDEKADLFHRTAARVYRLEFPMNPWSR